MKKVCVIFFTLFQTAVFCFSSPGINPAEELSGNEPGIELQPGPARFTFERDGFIWIYDGENEKKLVEGMQHSVSPNGKVIAFTKNFPDGNRSIAVYDIESGKVEVLDYFRNENNYEPRLSPDGRKIIFNYWTDNDWKIGYADLLTREFKTISEAGVYSPSWSADGKFILYHDLNRLYKASAEGSLIDSYSMNEVTCSESPGVSSATKFIYSPQENKIYYDLETEEEIGYPYNLMNGLFEYDIASGTCMQLTDKDLFAYEPVLTAGNKILFSGFFKNEVKQINDEEVKAEYSIFVFDPLSRKAIKILQNAYNPSIIN